MIGECFLWLPEVLAAEQPTSGSMPKGRGRWAPSDTHWTNSPSRQPSAIIQSAVEVAPSIRITVMTQHVNAITWDTKNAFISQAGIKIYAQKYKHEKFFFRKICTERNILKLFDDFEIL